MKLLPSFRRIFRKSNVKKQLNTLYFTSLLLPILIIGIILIFYSQKLLLTHYQNQARSDNTRVKSIMFDVTTTTFNISEEIFRDKELQTFLSYRYSDSQEAYNSCRVYYDKLRDYVTRNTFISSIELYTVNPTIYSYGTIMPITDETKQTEWYQQVSNHADVVWKSLQNVDFWKHSSQELCLLRRIPVIPTGEYAILIISVSNNYIKNRIQNNSLFNTVSVNQDPIFFSTERALSGKLQTVDIDYSQQLFQYSGLKMYDGKKAISQISTLIPYNSKNKIYITTLDFKALPDTTNIILIITLIILLGSIIPYIVFTLFNQRFSSRIITLRQEMHKASYGDYDIIDRFNGDDELSDAFSDLKHMIDSIKEMDSQMYESRIQEQILKNQQQKMEFMMLASQINPHFLYNTLETIRMKALMEGNPEVGNAIKLLGKSMHYVLENNGVTATSLKKEMDYIATYLTIQKMRFNDRVNYTLHISDNIALDDVQILPLLLQPVVENSILHGLERVKYNGQIAIKVEREPEDTLIIRISDNGMGMSEEELSAVNESLLVYDRSTTSIGLTNIHHRIKLFYGDAYGIQIQSHRGEGTVVTLTLPYIIA